MKQTNNFFLSIAYLYPRSMNIYGDQGNILALTKRCQWRGIKVTVTEIDIGKKFDEKKYDLVFAGGGQDRHQLRIADDLQTKKMAIHTAVENGIVFLLICGTYQLFGHYFKTLNGKKIKGISIFDTYTIGSKKRKIGNSKIKLTPFPEIQPQTLVGFENHSGDTYIAKSTVQKTYALGKVIHGYGNNASNDNLEGAVYKNCFGTYLHGSLLPKNPHFADYLLRLALENKYKQKNLKPLNDRLEFQAHNFVLKKR